MNKELLKKLYCLHSPSGGEKKMRRFIKRYIRKNCGVCKVEQDSAGNVFVTKGVADTYPCLASHIDQVQDAHSRDFVCIDAEGVIFGYSPKCHEQQGLGADDKNGILICLECLAKYDAIKVAFFVGEETGCKGSSACDLAFFSDCRFIIEPDRRGSSDLITSMFCGDVCSEDFIKAIGAEHFGYKEEQGSITDVGTLTERGVGISCLNLSCGYYEAHTDHEFTVLSELENCLNFVCHIIETCTDVYPFEYKPRYSYGSYYGSYYGGGRSYGRSYGWSDMAFEDEAYDVFSDTAKWYPEMTFEEACDFLDFGVLSSVSHERLREIFDDCKSLAELDEEEEAAEWNRAFVS